MRAALNLSANLRNKVKISIDDLVKAAGLIVSPLDCLRLENAIRSSLGARARTTTVSSTGGETKKAGLEFVQGLNLRTIKSAGVDARAIHWLAMAAEAAKCGWGVPSLAADSDEARWLGKFKVQVTPETKK